MDFKFDPKKETIQQYTARTQAEIAAANPNDPNSQRLITALPSLPQGGGVATPSLPDAPQSRILSFASSLDAAVNLARKSRNQSSLAMMQPFQGTVAASDFNSILSNLNAASDKTSSDLIKRATEEAAPIKLDTQVVNVGGHQVLIDTQTGKTIKDLGLVTDNSKTTPVKLPPGQVDDVATMDVLGKLIGDIQAAATGDGLPGVGAFGQGSIGGFTAAHLGFGGEGTEGQHVRDLIGNVKGTIAKLRGGTSFTPNEQALLESYTPNSNDSDAVIQQKLTDLMGFLNYKKQAIYTASGATNPSPTPAPTPTKTAETRVVNGYTYIKQADGLWHLQK